MSISVDRDKWFELDEELGRLRYDLVKLRESYDEIVTWAGRGATARPWHRENAKYACQRILNVAKWEEERRKFYPYRHGSPPNGRSNGLGAAQGVPPTIVIEEDEG